MPHLKHILTTSAIALLLSSTHIVSAQTGLLNEKPALQTPAPATTGKISGKLTDSKGVPLSYVTVTLLRTDSSVVNGDLSKDDGSFSIAPTGLGNFRLRIESIGSSTKFFNVTITADSLEKNLGKIKILQSETTLKTATVTGEKPVVELKVDKKVFNVEKNITSSGGSATDVLQNVPSVSVDVDGSVSLRGKRGVTILIDGKPATLLGSDVTSALQSMPASSIESVEVITNPSAKYDAQGTTGIINIITKKDGRLGINGNVTLGAGTRDKYNGNFGLNIRKGKWSAFMNANLRINNTYNNVITDRQDRAADTLGRLKSYHTYEHVPRNFSGSFNSIGVTYDVNKYNSFTITENINKMGFGFSDNSDYNIYSSANQAVLPIYHQNRFSKSSGGPLSLSSAIDYKHKFKKKDEELSIDATYATTTIQREQIYTTYADSPGVAGTHLYDIEQNAPGGGGNSTFNAWADYMDPLFTKNGKLGLGFKSQFYWFNSKNTPTTDTLHNSIPPVTDYSLYAKYDYEQQIHAAYVNWSDQVDKFSYQLGLRAETAEYKGTYQSAGDTSLKNSFTNLFPSAFVSYQLPGQQTVYLNYSRRTNRPNFFQLLPYLDLSNPSTVNTGNPDLIPEFIDNVEFSYNRLDKKGNNIIFSAYYQYTKNLIERLSNPIKEGQFMGLLESKPRNLESGTTFGLEAIGNLKLTKIWDATVNVNFFQNKIIIGEANKELIGNFTNRDGFGWFAKANTSLKLPAGFSLQANGNYESAKVIAQGKTKDTYWIDLALKKNMLKGKATLVLNVSDIFKTHRFINEFDQAQYYQTINRVKETRIGNITFTYRFGKTDVGKNIAGDKKEMKRPKEETKKTTQPNTEDRGKNMKDGEGGDDNGGGGGTPQGGGQKGK
ncbi:hypothetical protein CJD36_009295 [Flavipsychrobacter stenotrophus]|uniref:TonB-dependent receptor n=1 Tax=Flavipsychrobacter stenotrophus TaxID=2077091 RepID=A0A2S7SZH4_9BACT|nr:outer membrane beta-barrel family protein [Flavipsychrobacter stenotrophus]PQJ11975.1 hypothetical protein CJD36_009295 [Flavipsychrobacter stenotrophus]